MPGTETQPPPETSDDEPPEEAALLVIDGVAEVVDLDGSTFEPDRNGQIPPLFRHEHHERRLDPGYQYESD